ncbi:MAG: permease prefix domain 1-containing protein [Clostridiales bacterium]
MQSTNKKTADFLKSVCNEIKFKNIHNDIKKELSNHIEDQKDNFVKQGINENIATEKAIKQMGDPVTIGTKLNKIHRPYTDWPILSIIAIFILLSGIVQYFMSSVYSYTFVSIYRFFIYSVIGIVMFAFIYFSDYSFLKNSSIKTFFVLLTILLLSIIKFNVINGTYTFLYYFTLLFIPLLASIMYKFKDSSYLGILLSNIFFITLMCIFIFTNAKTSIVLLSISCFLTFTFAIIKGGFGKNKILSLIIAYVPNLITIIALYINGFFSSFINCTFYPNKDPMNYGYLILLVRKLISTSKPFEGSNSTFTNLALPNDYTLTFLISTFGYIPGILIIGILTIFIIRIFALVFKQKNLFESILSFSICLVISEQIILYILSNTGVISGNFMTVLPLISYGSLGFIFNIVLIGLLLSMYRTKNVINKSNKNLSNIKFFFSKHESKSN